ncbi:MAG: GNAT family N-acetyltransferase [Euryarchaeota archaeon]|nr:GNAT family N-acetyltransferase [Euryarchaeota archaeon]
MAKPARLPKVSIVDVTPETIAWHGLFCQKSKKKSEGYLRKLRWVMERFKDGLRYKMLLTEDGHYVGFIEYMPGERSWRNVEADGYMVIHCLWVIGRFKAQGMGSRLIGECIADAKRDGMSGVAMVTSGKNWLAHSELFLRLGFEVADSAPPFEIVVMRFGNAPHPRFRPPETPGKEKSLRIFRSDQCPYIPQSIDSVRRMARAQGIEVKITEMGDCGAVRECPFPYGTFGITYDGRALTYRPIGGEELRDRHMVKLD